MLPIFNPVRLAFIFGLLIGFVSVFLLFRPGRYHFSKDSTYDTTFYRFDTARGKLAISVDYSEFVTIPMSPDTGAKLREHLVRTGTIKGE